MFAHIDATSFSCAIFSGVCLALAGALPAVFLNELDTSTGSKKKQLLSILLNFAVGSLLADVFLHLLPDIWQQTVASNSYYDQCLVLLCGFFVCVFIERIFNDESEDSDDSESESCSHDQTEQLSTATPSLNGSTKNGSKSRPLSHSKTQPNSVVHASAESWSAKQRSSSSTALKNASETETKGAILRRSKSVHVSAYLNLAANVMDNLLHGISIGGAYVLGVHVGALTTFAVLVHEVPHEISDFAILLRAGLSRARAARLQIMTGCVSLLGVIFAFLSAAYSHGKHLAQLASLANKTLLVNDTLALNGTLLHGVLQDASLGNEELPWIVPFTIGAFVYISLTSVVPEIARLDEEVRAESDGSWSSRMHSALQLLSLASGVLLVHFATLLI